MRIIKTTGKSKYLHIDLETVAADAHYVHDQAGASAHWVINHNLNKHPSVTIATSAGDVVEGDISYPSVNTVELFFSAPFAGKAYLN